MSIGSFEIIFCALAAAGALAAYGLLVVFVGRCGVASIRTDALVVFGPPVLCVLAAALTPPDMVSLLILAIPLCGLYSLAVVIWLIFRYRKPRRNES
jgi:Sec-independent protein secretion pathway component TatC